jgi:hypothetical protein
MANKTLAITSKLTMIVASAAFSMLESRRSMRECFRNSTDDITSQPASEHWWAQRDGRIGASLCLRIKL